MCVESATPTTCASVNGDDDAVLLVSDDCCAEDVFKYVSQSAGLTGYSVANESHGMSHLMGDGQQGELSVVAGKLSCPTA